MHVSQECISREAFVREADSYPRPIYLGNGSDGMIVRYGRVVRRRHANSVGSLRARVHAIMYFFRKLPKIAGPTGGRCTCRRASAAGSRSSLRDKSDLVQDAGRSGGSER